MNTNQFSNGNAQINSDYVTSTVKTSDLNRPMFEAQRALKTPGRVTTLSRLWPESARSVATMNRFRISTRVWLLVAVLGVLLISVGILGLYGTNHSNASLKSVYEDRTVALSDITDTSYFAQRNRVLVMDMIVRRTPENLEKRKLELRSNLEATTKHWDAYMASNLTPEEKLLAADLATVRGQYVMEGLLPTVEALTHNEFEKAEVLYADKISPLSLQLRVAEKKLKELQVKEAKREYESAVARYEVIKLLFIASISLGVAFAAIFGFALVRGISRSLSIANDAATSIAAGDLTMVIDSHGRDEVAMLLQRMANMQSSLTNVVSSVRSGSESVATASAQIAQGNADLSQRTEEQASALEETAATMEQLGSTVRNNADNAHQANQLAQTAAGLATRGGEVVGQVVGKMQGISESSRRIGDIIGVIDGIAFQTNILALNAAVEAARAGEQGRGFAVVAGEVRTLAQRSAEAAKEIRSLITRNVEQVEQGTALVDLAGQTMYEIVGSIKRVSDIVAEISFSTTEQSNGIHQVGDAVGQMDQVTQQNAALVEESASAAESLNTQAQQLVQAVAFFKTAGGSEPVLTPEAIWVKPRPSAVNRYQSKGSSIADSGLSFRAVKSKAYKSSIAQGAGLAVPAVDTKAKSKAEDEDEDEGWGTF